MKRKRLFTFAGLAVAGLTAWIAAPALSLTPYAPAAVDFEQALPPVTRVAALAPASALRAAAAQPSFIPAPHDGPVVSITPPMTAPKPFDVVGLVGDEHPVEFRTQRAGAGWSAWHEVDSGDPVWAGDSIRVQLRSRGYPLRGRLHYVNVTATESPLHQVVATMRGAIHSAFVSAAGVAGAGADTAMAAGRPGRPPVVLRTQWDSGNGCPPRRTPKVGKANAAVIHHTVNTNDYTAAEAPGIVLAICRFHRNGNKWDDIGYNALVDRFGKLYEGRAGGLNRAVIGAHAQGFNDQTTAISSIGDHRTVPIPAPALDAIERYLAWKLFTVGHVHARTKVTLVSGGGSLNRWKKGKKVTVYRVTFHSALGKTDCPGNAGRSAISKIIAGVERYISRGGSGSPNPPPPPGDSGGTGTTTSTIPVTITG